MYFKFQNILGIPGQFCCYGICHCFLISIVFWGFSLSQPYLLFFISVHTFLTHWCLDKWKTMADFNGLFRNIKTSHRVIFWNRIQKDLWLSSIFFPLYHHLVWSFSWMQCQAGIPSSSLAVHFCLLCIISLTAHQNSVCSSRPAKNSLARYHSKASIIYRSLESIRD